MYLEAVFIGGNDDLARQIFVNQGGFFDACKKASKKKPTTSDGSLTAEVALNPMNLVCQARGSWRNQTQKLR